MLRHLQQDGLSASLTAEPGVCPHLRSRVPAETGRKMFCFPSAEA